MDGALRDERIILIIRCIFSFVRIACFLSYIDESLLNFLVPLHVFRTRNKSSVPFFPLLNGIGQIDGNSS